MGSPVDAGSRLRRWGGPLVILAAALWMLRLTWRGWPDPIVDFGRELYAPWRILEGDRLYADLAYYNGPLSPHLNAAWFALDGVSLASLLHLNLLILAGVLALLYAQLLELSNRAAASLACVSVVVLFAFGQFTGIGNYNWLAPYSHEVTHGIALALVAIQLVWRFARSGSRWLAGASGLAVGAVGLTKGEVFLAAGLAVALGLALALRARRAATAESARVVGCWLLGAALPHVAAALLLALAMPWGEALRGTFSVWVHGFQSRNLAQPFYRTIAGTQDAAASAWRMLRVAAGSVLALGPAAILARWRARDPERRFALALAAGGVWACAFVVAASRFPWSDWLLPLPVWLALLFGAAGARFARERDDADAAARGVLRLSLLCFSGLLLGKMALNAKVGHYGFGLAMPGTALLCVALLAWLPAAIDRRGGAGSVFAAAAAAVWIGVLLGHYGFVARFAAGKTVTVGAGEDAFRADPRGAALNEAVRRIEARLGEHATLATFVDCEMLNYLTRRPSSVRYAKFIPQELLLFGESNVLESLRRSPPDLVALVHADTSEYGPRFFGSDYGRSLWDWVRANYRPWGEPIGAPPMQGERFGIALFEPRERGPDARP